MKIRCFYLCLYFYWGLHCSNHQNLYREVFGQETISKQEMEEWNGTDRDLITRKDFIIFSNRLQGSPLVSSAEFCKNSL